MLPFMKFIFMCASGWLADSSKKYMWWVTWAVPGELSSLCHGQLQEPVLWQHRHSQSLVLSLCMRSCLRNALPTAFQQKHKKKSVRSVHICARGSDVLCPGQKWAVQSKVDT